MSKYGSRKTVVDGIVFDSAKEADRYLELKLLSKAGIVQNIQCQVPFELVPRQTVEGRTVRPVIYYADFVYEQDGKTIVEDVKGFATPEYKIKKKLMYWRYGIWIKET